MVITHVKASVDSGKMIYKVRRESGKLSTIGCHFPPKSTNFGTMPRVGNITFVTHTVSGLRLSTSL